MTRSKPKLLLGLLLVLTLLAPASAGLFGPPSYVFKGRVNYIQPTNFTLLTDDNQMYRIMIFKGERLPAEIQLGVQVEVKAVQGQDSLWYLDKFEKVKLLPSS